MTTLEYVQMEAALRNCSVDDLMAQYRGTETKLGAAIEELDVEWLQDFAVVMGLIAADTEIWH